MSWSSTGILAREENPSAPLTRAASSPPSTLDSFDAEVAPRLVLGCRDAATSPKRRLPTSMHGSHVRSSGFHLDPIPGRAWLGIPPQRHLLKWRPKLYRALKTELTRSARLTP